MTGEWWARATEQIAAWGPMVLWSLTRVALRIIDRYFAIRHTTVHAEATAAILKALAPGVSLQEQGADGSKRTITATPPIITDALSPGSSGAGTDT